MTRDESHRTPARRRIQKYTLCSKPSDTQLQYPSYIFTNISNTRQHEATTRSAKFYVTKAVGLKMSSSRPGARTQGDRTKSQMILSQKTKSQKRKVKCKKSKRIKVNWQEVKTDKSQNDKKSKAKSQNNKKATRQKVKNAKGQK